MKRLTPILGLAGVAFASLSANAQVFQYNDGDLILDFSKSGSSDLEVDVGNISRFTSQAAGTTVTLGGYNVNTQLLPTFGGSLSGVQFGVFGTTGLGASPIDYLTLRRQNAGTQNAAPNDFTPSNAGTISSDVYGIVGAGAGTGILPWSSQNPANSVNNTATAVVIPTSGAQNVHSFTTIYNANGGLRSSLPTPGIVNTAGTGGVSDLFEYFGSGASAQAVFLGDFTFNSDGSVSFTTPSAVPEPSSYALLAGGLLLLAFRKRFQLNPA